MNSQRAIDGCKRTRSGGFRTATFHLGVAIFFGARRPVAVRKKPPLLELRPRAAYVLLEIIIALTVFSVVVTGLARALHSDRKSVV